MRPGMSEALAHADALFWLAQGQETRPAREPSWVSYGGGEAIILTIVLLMAAIMLFVWPANGEVASRSHPD
jgi:F0F1-type ATP synthase assembly protein I